MLIIWYKWIVCTFLLWLYSQVFWLQKTYNSLTCYFGIHPSRSFLLVYNYNLWYLRSLCSSDTRRYQLIRHRRSKLRRRKVFWKRKSESQVLAGEEKERGRRVKRAATARPERIWDYAVIPYEIDSNFSGVHKVSSSMSNNWPLSTILIVSRHYFKWHCCGVDAGVNAVIIKWCPLQFELLGCEMWKGRCHK